MLRQFIFVGLVFLKLYGGSSGFLYDDGPDGPDHWCKIEAEGNNCCGSRQSPINIDLGQIEMSLIEIEMTGLDYKWSTVSITNDRHSVKLEVPNIKYMEIPYVTLWPEPDNKSDTYSFINMHFHFGSENNVGSEHHIDDEIFPMESHAVFYNTRYGIDAPNHPDGVIVLGSHYEISPHDNYHYFRLTNALANVQYVDQVFTIDPGLAINGLLPNNKTVAYSYPGSLTTPLCSEAVTWFVFKDRVPISQGQLDKFRELTILNQQETNDVIETPSDANIYMYNNYRPIQEINGRQVQLVKGRVD